ncbi:thioesterase family protein [Alteromonas sp. 1_MG-2023]|uniref:thioesterase family protein n=1 Tax=Alteromonas sp. 1_MG-2023 TaxID=3062669 RepID=UPI0026E2E791|nr:thioesterase family protein [Alteromonas sp. 1_MG-2023]MDO6566626.1 thioesterase family protein [Alteromonas sp. 1_MG-2023]
MRTSDNNNMLSRNDMIAHVISLFRDTMPFIKLLELEFVRPDSKKDDDKEGDIELHVSWREALTGNPLQKILHGGVTATMLDTIGGLVAIIETIKRTSDADLASLQTRLPKFGTVDMRVDYLRPGRGGKFIATAKVIRGGARLAVCRMELHNEKGDHIAFGTGTYMFG